MAKIELYKLRSFVVTIHSIGCLEYIFAIYYDHVYLKIPENFKLPMVSNVLGGKMRFLTYWCLVSVKKTNLCFLLIVISVL